MLYISVNTNLSDKTVRKVRSMIKFGPAGNSLSFYEQGGKSTVQAMPWIAELGLNAYEYSCGKGINVGEDTALKIGAAAAECGVEVSVHAPYYTNLANPFTDKREATNRYIIGALKVARLMGFFIPVHT